MLNFRTPYTHFFVQDDWRVTRRLTLNLGLRYELNSPSVDQNDAIANFDLDTDPANPRIVLAGSRGRRSRASRALVDVNYKQFAPRAGFAYLLPGDQTVAARRRRHLLREHDHGRRHVVARDQPAESRAHQPDDRPDDSVDLPEPGLCG